MRAQLNIDLQELEEPDGYAIILSAMQRAFSVFTGAGNIENFNGHNSNSCIY